MKKYRAAVIGLGNIGLMYDFDPKRTKPSTHSLAYEQNENIRYAAAMDLRSEQSQYLRDISADAVFYHSIEEILQSAAMDIVSICTPPNHHYTNIQDIFKYSQTPPKVIFCEKPVLSNIDQYKEIKALLHRNGTLLVPNFIRRWSSGIQVVDHKIKNGEYGKLLKIHLRYTRGIFNTGSHLFDLVHLFAGEIQTVQTLFKVHTSAEEDHDPSFTFVFTTVQGVNGFAEAFNDESYYLFELDLFFERGKIEIRNSGDSIYFYGVVSHPLFSGFNSLGLEDQLDNLFQESTLKNAVDELVRLVDGSQTNPSCTIEDGIKPILVAKTLMYSYENGNSLERVVYPSE